MNVHQFNLPIDNERDLFDFLRLALGIRIPNTRVCEDHKTPWEAFTAAYFAKDPIAIWKASRGFGGKSFTLATLAFVEALTLKADVNILGGSGKQSQNVVQYFTQFWQYPNAPLYLLKSDPSMQITRLSWGNKIEALMASQTSVRGGHPQRLRLDEIDEMNIKIFDAAMGQTMSRAGITPQTVASSTHQYPDGTMTEVLRRAAAKGWPVYEWCYQETKAAPYGWLDPNEVERKRIETTAEMWKIEYDLQEPSFENRAIAPEAVEFMFDPALGEYEGGIGSSYIFEAPMLVCRSCGREYEKEAEPLRSCMTCGSGLYEASYSHGADWAKELDATVIITLRNDITPRRIVAYECLGRQSWPSMVARLDNRINYYGGSAAHDAFGVGNVVSDYLRNPVEDVYLSGQTRVDLINNCVLEIERNAIVSPMIKHMYNEIRRARTMDLFGAGHLPDTLSSLVTALHAAGRAYGGIHL